MLCGKEMIMEDIYYPKYGSMKEIYKKRMLISVEKELDELKQMHQVIGDLFGGNDVPLFLLKIQPNCSIKK